jgi:YHS domain-containing protein
MLVIRLAVLALLAAVAWYLVRGFLDRARGAVRKADKPAASKGQDVLVEDPVCHTLVPKSQAIRLRRDTITYYFCSEACCDTFSGKGKEEK